MHKVTGRHGAGPVRVGFTGGTRAQVRWLLGVCINYRSVNSLTVRATYLLPQVADYIDSPGDATICTALDARSEY